MSLDKTYKLTFEHFHEALPDSLEHEIYHEEAEELVVEFLLNQFECWMDLSNPIEIKNYSEQEDANDDDVDEEYLQALAVIIKNHVGFEPHINKWKELRSKLSKAVKKKQKKTKKKKD